MTKTAFRITNVRFAWSQYGTTADNALKEFIVFAIKDFANFEYAAWGTFIPLALLSPLRIFTIMMQRSLFLILVVWRPISTLAQLQNCMADLMEADMDGNGKLSTGEYMEFLAWQSDGRLPDLFTELPF